MIKTLEHFLREALCIILVDGFIAISSQLSIIVMNIFKKI